MAAARQRLISRFSRAAGAGFPGTGPVMPRQIYGLGLLLLLVLFVMLTFRGRPPKALDRVFAAPPATEEVLAERRAQVAKIMNGALHDPPDGAPFAETPGYQRLLRKMIDHQRPEDVVTNAPLLDYDVALRSPELQRGETVKVRGVVAAQDAIKLSEPIFELTDVWRVVLTDTEGDNGVIVDLPERPPALEARRNIVEVTGLFYRLVTFESKKGETRTAPYLVARTLAVVPEVRDTTAPLSDPAVVLLMLGMGAMIVWGVFRVFSAQRRPTVRWRAPHLS